MYTQEVPGPGPADREAAEQPSSSNQLCVGERHAPFSCERKKDTGSGISVRTQSL